MLIERAVPQVIASALESHDAEIGAEATALMHELGEGGWINLDAQVSTLRQPLRRFIATEEIGVICSTII